jgi:hypothetical protein
MKVRLSIHANSLLMNRLTRSDSPAGNLLDVSSLNVGDGLLGCVLCTSLVWRPASV